LKRSLVEAGSHFVFVYCGWAVVMLVATAGWLRLNFFGQVAADTVIEVPSSVWGMFMLVVLWGWPSSLNLFAWLWGMVVDWLMLCAVVVVGWLPFCGQGDIFWLAFSCDSGLLLTTRMLLHLGIFGSLLS
jgi:hypothetical protein